MTTEKPQKIIVERKIILPEPYDGYKRPIDKDRELRKEVEETIRKGKYSQNSINRLMEHYRERVHPYISEDVQRKALESKAKLLNAFCNLGEAGGLHFYPELITETGTSDLVIDLERKIIESLAELTSKKHPKTDSKDLIEVTREDNGYIVSESDFRPDLGLRLEITRIRGVGSRIIVAEYYGNSRTTYEAIHQFAPSGANAYWEAYAKKLVVRESGSKHHPPGVPKVKGMNSMRSLVSGDTWLYVQDIPEGEYDITPVRYFRIETENPVKRMRKELAKLKTNYLAEKRKIESFYNI